MLRARAAALGVSLALSLPGFALAQSPLWPGAPGVSPEVLTALANAQQDNSASLLALAEAGLSDAQVLVGSFYIFGVKGLVKDGVKGCDYERKASASRADAMHLLGECYQFGYGGETDVEKALVAFHRAGDMGSHKSRCAEGNVLFSLGRDEARAFGLCREGAEAGDPDAQTDVGNFYLVGQHVPKDVIAARGWDEKAVASSRQPNAALVLGQIYWNGDGVTKDREKAAAYWRVAYEGGRSDAAKFLGDEALLRAGRGEGIWDPAGLEEAADWYDKASASPVEAIRQEAIARRDLARQLVGVMQRRAH